MVGLSAIHKLSEMLLYRGGVQVLQSHTTDKVLLAHIGKPGWSCVEIVYQIQIILAAGL